MFEVFSANRYIAFIASNLNLLSVANRFAMEIYSQNHGCFSATMTNRLYLVERISPGHQVLASLKEIPLEVGPQTVCQHWNVEIIADIT